MSYNFNPQPRPFPPPFSTAGMFRPSAPRINNPVLPGGRNFLTQNYWEGAVHISAGNGIDGELVSGDFTNFTCSFWGANLLPIDQLVLQHFSPCIIAPTGSFQFSQDPFPNPTFLFGQFCVLLSWDGTPMLAVLNAASTSILRVYAGPSPVMGVDTNFDPIPPIGAWHHYIVSYSPTLPRVQFVVDRTRLVESVLGPARGAFSNPVGANWQTLAATNASIDMAYFYFGTSDTFFDLTTSGNLDYFVSSSLTPVNLGPSGSNVTPLTCRIMHTGNAANLFGAPTINPWQGYLNYAFSAVVEFEGKNYFDIFIGDNINNRPDVSPNFWNRFTPSTGFQFYYNAANGKIWGGTLEDALTQPPIGV